MKTMRFLAAPALAVLTLASTGCGIFRAPKYYEPPPPVRTHGAINDDIWQRMEEHAEASEFVIPYSEFRKDDVRLNTKGEEHLKQIAVRLKCGQDFPVVVERSIMKVRENTQFRFPIHPDPELDLKRRDVIVHLLGAMGVNDAEQRVVVADDYVENFTGSEAQQAYQSSGRGGFGAGGFGGLGGFGNPFGFGGFF